MIQIDLMGPFAVRTEDAPCPFEARSAAALVAYVALSRGRPVSRDAAAAALWPDHDSASARTNLRKALQRVRRACPDEEILVAQGDDLTLAPNVETDLDRAERLHRTYLLATRQPEGAAALAEEWAIRRLPLLEGWEDDWVLPQRTRATLIANDLGADLARAHEAMGDLSAALVVWRDILARVPHHAQALQNALRLESGLHGTEQAAELARLAQIHFRDELGIEMPQELRRALRDFGTGALEPVPPPDSLRKRSELYLLARMFESNLAANRTEALELLARECTVPKALSHPRSMLSLLTLALEQTEGDSPERLEVAVLATTVASWAAQYEVGHRWSDYVLAVTGRDDPRRASVLSMKGFMHFEQRDYPAAERALDEAVAIFRCLGREDDAARARIGRGAVYWHLQGFEPAIGIYQATLDLSEGRTDEVGTLMRASANSNLCFVYTTMGRWDDAVPHGKSALALADEHPVFAWIVPGALGLSHFARGERAAGCRFLARGLASTLREGMTRFNQITLDFAALALFLGGRERSARCLLDANVVQRATLRHARSPAEAGLVALITGAGPKEMPLRDNPLAGQPAATLSEWACEELSRLDGTEAERPLAAF